MFAALDGHDPGSTRNPEHRRLLAVTSLMNRCNVIAVGASAGGLESLLQLVARLPGALEAAVAVTLHMPEESPSALPAILSRNGPLLAKHATDGEALFHGRI